MGVDHPGHQVLTGHIDHFCPFRNTHRGSGPYTANPAVSHYQYAIRQRLRIGAIDNSSADKGKSALVSKHRIHTNKCNSGPNKKSFFNCHSEDLLLLLE